MDGPYVFSGLPGLILELYDINMDYHFSLASISPLKEKYNINLKADNTKVITKEEFIGAYIKFKENPASRIAGRMVPPPPPGPPSESGRVLTRKDIEGQIKERVAKRNNQIEIW